MIIEMPYGKITITSLEDAIHFIKYRCNNCPHSDIMHQCSGYQASLCDKQEQELIKKIKAGEIK